MSTRFFSRKYASLTPYTPGEQPRDRSYIKLNTNESPFPPSARAVAAAARAAESLNLYSDPTCLMLRQALAETLRVDPDEIICTNGSDEILNFAFMAFCDEDHPAVFPDITYGFYPVFAALNGVPYTEIPLTDDFTVRVEDYIEVKKTVFIANPNAPTGIALPVSAIERILASNPDHIVVVDEAYVDFGGESCVPLIRKYDNLLVTQTFSKSRSMAGARLGFGVACKSLIRDLETVRYSTNPYNVNSMTLAAGIGCLSDAEYMKKNCKTVMETRERTAEALTDMGFCVLPSSANFLFASHPVLDGGELYQTLKARGILVRHFNTPRLCAYNRITVGSPEQMQTLVDTLRAILHEANP